MPRHRTLLATLLLALPSGTSASAAVLGSELVLVADGPATGTVTLPRKVTGVRYTVTTKSPYAAVVLTQAGRLEYGLATFAGRAATAGSTRRRRSPRAVRRCGCSRRGR